MNRRDAVVTIPAAISAVALKLKANPTPGKPPAPVTQAELQEVIDLQNLVEVRALGIGQRLEAGASLEAGQLGASITMKPPLEELVAGNAVETDAYGVIDIAPAADIRRERNEFPQLAHQIWVS
jgi:hypothetical protein